MTKSAWKFISIKTPLEIIGAALFVIGILDWLANTNIVPKSFQFDNYPIVLIIAGIILAFHRKQSFSSLDDPESH